MFHLKNQLATKVFSFVNLDFLIRRNIMISFHTLTSLPFILFFRNHQMLSHLNRIRTYFDMPHLL
jgi:hypothetical protein